MVAASARRHQQIEFASFLWRNWKVFSYFFIPQSSPSLITCCGRGRTGNVLRVFFCSCLTWVPVAMEAGARRRSQECFL